MRMGRTGRPRRSLRPVPHEGRLRDRGRAHVPRGVPASRGRNGEHPHGLPRGSNQHADEMAAGWLPADLLPVRDGLGCSSPSSPGSGHPRAERRLVRLRRRRPAPLASDAHYAPADVRLLPGPRFAQGASRTGRHPRHGPLHRAGAHVRRRSRRARRGGRHAARLPSRRMAVSGHRLATRHRSDVRHPRGGYSH